MPSSNYNKGRQLEYKIKKLFDDNGWDTTRMASSKGSFAVRQSCPHCGKTVPFKPDIIASQVNRKNKDTIYVILLQAKRSGK